MFDLQASVVSSQGRSLDLLPNVHHRAGIYEVQKDVWVEILEERTVKKHKNFRASLPDSKGIEDEYEGGPVYTVYAEDSYVDVEAGLTLIDGVPVRQTAVVKKLVEQYVHPSSQILESARRMDENRIILPLASQRMANYCRWWLDSVAKIFICYRSSLLRSHMRGSALDVVMPQRSLNHIQQTIETLRWQPACSIYGDRILRGRSVNSSGLTFGGGQRIATMVRDFSQFLEMFIPTQIASAPPNSEFLYVSRNEGQLRRLVNEEAILPGLRDLGFRIFQPGKEPLNSQVEAFRAARVVLAPHGAGLTNIVFCRPNTTLIEIFPEGGVHPSAFFRIASQLDFDYFFVVGGKSDTVMGAKNPNNSDIILNSESFFGFLREILGSLK